MPNVLLIGIDYFANRCSSDKNYWHAMLPALAETLQRIVVISYNYRRVSAEIQPTPNRDIQIYNVRPSHLGIDLRADPSTAHNPEKCHSHFKSPPRSPVEYFASCVRVLPLIRRLIAEQSITNMHCMDNFGPVMRLMRRWISPVPLSVSAMGYYARGPLHDRYLQLCYQGVDAIVPYSQAYGKKLESLGVPAGKLHVIPWGIDVESVEEPATSEEQSTLKQGLELEPDCQMVLWAGFLQQIREKELQISIEIASGFARRRDDVQFVFALKPECYDPSLQRFSTPQIRLLSTSNEVFFRLLRAADYFLSPIANTRSIVTPPLTWLEAMAAGVPIITNEVPGVEAVITSGANGFVAENLDGIAQLLEQALSSTNRKKMRKKAREHIENYYTIARSANDYRELWQELRYRLGMGDNVES
jgi:glycosyltransferase involved in cell wall biosynthesis